MPIYVRKPTPPARVTLRLPADLWKKAQHYTIDHDLTAQDLVARALEAYLKGEVTAKK